MNRPVKERIFQRLEGITHVALLSSFENPDKYFTVGIRMGWNLPG